MSSRSTRRRGRAKAKASTPVPAVSVQGSKRGRTGSTDTASTATAAAGITDTVGTRSRGTPWCGAPGQARLRRGIHVTARRCPARMWGYLRYPPAPLTTRPACAPTALRHTCRPPQAQGSQRAGSTQAEGAPPHAARPRPRSVHTRMGWLLGCPHARTTAVCRTHGVKRCNRSLCSLAACAGAASLPSSACPGRHVRATSP